MGSYPLKQKTLQAVPMKMQGETRIAIAILAERERIPRATIRSWCRKGAYGTVLESFKIGGKRYTTDEAFQRFLEA